ncbi:MAG: NPCBM/NEW2 domain-containing protein [Clostridia bacterium]|nr:NPCBM/NEW2 domain-containing protein [Clostridia bacterium]
MKIIIIAILTIAGILLTAMEYSQKGFKRAICTVVATILVALATNAIWEFSANNIGNTNFENNPPIDPPVGTTVNQDDVDETNDVNNYENANNTGNTNGTETSIANKEIKKEKISILDVETFYSDGMEYENDEITDNEGNTYIGYAHMDSSDFLINYDGSAVYQNDGKYTRFTGRVITRDRFKNAENCGWIRIYGDEEVIFYTEKVCRGVHPIDFDIDISNYNEIRIEFKGGDYSNHASQYRYEVARCYLVNTYFIY